MIKQFRLSTILTGLAMLAAGLFFVLKPGLSVALICYALAAICLVLAVTRFLSCIQFRKESGIGATGDLILSILMLGLAIFFVLRPAIIAALMPIILGILVLSDGVIMIISAVMFRSFLPKRGLLSFIVGLIAVVLGLVAMTHSFATDVVFMQFIGISLMVSAISTLLNHIMLEGADKRKHEATTVDFSTEKNEQE